MAVTVVAVGGYCNVVLGKLLENFVGTVAVVVNHMTTTAIAVVATIVMIVMVDEWIRG